MAVMIGEKSGVARAGVDPRIAGLEARHLADQGLVTGFEAVGIVDAAVIAQLEADRVADREKIANLEIALASARRIGAAIGVIMAGFKVTEEQAFAILRKASQHQNRKLRDVADDVLLTGAVD